MALVANTAPVAFGAIAIPIVTLAEVTELPKDDLGAMVGRQTPFLALIVPLILVGMVDGRRGIRQAWPAAVVGGLTFAVGQFVCSNYVSVELTDIVASLLSRRRDRRARCRSGSPPSRCSASGRRQPARDRRRRDGRRRRTRPRCAAAATTTRDTRARRDRRPTPRT